MIKCIVYNMPPCQAIEYTGANVSKQGIYQRIARWRKSLAPPNLAQLQAIEEEWNSPPAFSSSESTAPIEESPTTIDLPSESLLKGCGATQVSPATMQALADGPSWLDPDKTLAAMTLRHRRTPAQVCRANFDCNAKTKYYRGRYTRAFKEATIELSNNQANKEMRGKRGYGEQAIAEKVNTSMLSSPNDHKLSATSLQRAIESKRAGQSPSKLGRPERIPFQLVAALAKQSAMMQVASEGEASGKKIKALTEGLVTGTKWESAFSTEYCWRRTRSQYPEILNPVRAKINEDRRVEWLTYKNIIDWTAAAKKFLIAIGMAKDEPGIIRGYLALYSIEQQQLILVVFRYISFTRRRGAIRYISDPP
jgi:hypothetical protein